MRKKRTSDRDQLPRAAIERRTALKTLGAMALYGPVLASIACDGDPEGTDASSSPATGGSDSGSNPGPATGGAGSDAGGASSGGSDAGGSSGGGADGGVQAHADAATSGATDAGADSAMTALGDAGAGTGGFFPPMFVDAPMCTLTATDSAGEGPFFIHEDEVMTDPSIKRVDMRGGREGVELQLNYRLLDMDGNCMKPIADVEVYTWHTDALGLYSGFTGQNPDKAYAGGPTTPGNDDRFCRGMQVTNADGVVSFRSIYPGWYYGRPIHIHFVALRKGSGPALTSYRSTQYMVFTTQMYFDEQISRKIHENNAPYTTRTMTAGYTTYVKPNAMSKVVPQTRFEGNVVVASLNLITSSKGSRGDSPTGF